MRPGSTITFALAALLVSGVHAADAPRPLSLDAAVKLALEKSPDVATARQRLAAARAGLAQTDAAFLPQVRLSGTYSASDNPVQAFMMTLNQRDFNFNANFNHPPVTENLNGRLAATYSLYNGGRDQANQQAARLGAEAQEKSIDAVRNELVFEVTRIFHTIGKARRFVQTADAAVASMEKNLGTAKSRFQEGATMKTDVLDAEVRLAEARENLVRARSTVAISETIFRNVLGVGEKENVTAAEAADRSGSVPIVVMNESLDVSGRAELLAAQKAVAATERQVRAAQGGRRPRVNAFASYDLDSGDVRRYADSWLAGVSVEVDVFDGFLMINKVAEARANLDVAREQLRKLELGLQLEAKQAQLNLTEAQSRLETTTQVITQAEESVQITKERYAQGLALLTQLFDAETALTAARQRRAAAEVDVLIARAALDKALGKNWKE